MKQSQLINLRQDSGKTTIELPARQLGKSKLIGWIPLLFGVILLIMGITWMSVVWRMQLNVGGPQPRIFSWILFAFGGFGLMPFFYGVKTSALGIALLSNRTRTSLWLKNKTLVVSEKFFGFSLKRKVSLLNVSQLSIHHLLYYPPREGIAESDENSKIPEFLTNLIPDDCCVLTTGGSKKGGMVVFAYPEDVLLEAGQAIQGLLNKVEMQLPGDIVVIDGVVPNTASAKTATVEVVNLVSGPDGATDSGDGMGQDVEPYRLPAADYQLPPESALTVSQKDGTDVYQVPAPGFQKSATLFFALVWNGLVTAFTVLIISDVFKPNNPQQFSWPEFLGILAFLSVFWAVGIGFILWTVDMARRSVMIGVTGPLMFIETKGVFGTKWVEFDRKEISSIAVRDSNTSVNEKPIRHLAIETVDGQTRGMFNNLEEEELQWLSARLKNSLQLTFKSRLDVKRAWCEEGTLILPKATRIKADQRVGETVIEIPPATLLQHIGNLVGTLLALAFVSAFIYVGIIKGDLMFLLIPSLMAIGVLVLGIAKQVTLRQSWSIRASPQRLTIKRRGWLSSKAYEVEIDRLKRVALHSTGSMSANQKQHQLQVHRHDAGEKIKLMTGWSIEELRYVAGLILEATDRKPPVDAAPPQAV